MAVPIRSMLDHNHGQIRLCETHDRESTEIIRRAKGSDGRMFHGIWYGGLCQTTDLGIPDIELLSPFQRAVLMSPNNGAPKGKNTRPLCAAFDADSGGPIDDIPAMVGVLSLKGVSMIIVEDKQADQPGMKVNSLAESSGDQLQADPQHFAHVIRAFKQAIGSKDIMITARIESFTTRVAKSDAAEEAASRVAAHNDALDRAAIYCEAGVDAIMIHSKSKAPDEVLNFCKDFRAREPTKPLVLVPTTYSTTSRKTLLDAGANVVIYANHVLRAKMKAIGAVTDKIVKGRPDLFSEDAELSACLQARNYGCLLRELSVRRYEGEESKDTLIYRVLTATLANENMTATVQELLEGELSGCEADERIVSVKDLLKVNLVQVSNIKKLFM